MATAVQVTLVICCTVVLLVVFTNLSDRRHWGSAARGDRLGLYKRFLAALAQIKSDPSDRRAWDRLSSAAHAISLAAPPDVVSLTVKCCREIRERRSPPDVTTARTLLLAYRRDLGLPEVANPQAFDFDVVPDSPRRERLVRLKGFGTPILSRPPKDLDPGRTATPSGCRSRESVGCSGHRRREVATGAVSRRK